MTGPIINYTSVIATMAALPSQILATTIAKVDPVTADYAIAAIDCALSDQCIPASFRIRSRALVDEVQGHVRNPNELIGTRLRAIAAISDYAEAVSVSLRAYIISATKTDPYDDLLINARRALTESVRVFLDRNP